MQQEFAIGRCSRRCQRSDRELRPGECYYSVITEANGQLTREDISAEQWSGPPAASIGWWKQRMPVADSRALRPAPVGVLLETLSNLAARPGSESLAYLLALLLVRRRVLIEEDVSDEDAVISPGNQEPSHWRLNLPADGRQWIVPLAEPHPDELESLQQELTRLLFTEE